ncbi:hypothetical protein DXG03_005743 [Asterophora parasitica]|uniref:O-methyltransferase C-terminal domain-containing protein n=1 Tax=Asterophora parasitica TaxID=117018 RepID=A0A9P7GA59_9AGAR|nr:hypothetical protein DXG03_005743 [Asterophora parasitica]
MTTPVTPLSALAAIISSNVKSLEAAYATHGADFPSLDDPFRPTPLDFDPTLHQTKALIVAAAAQILASVRSPIETLQEYAPGMYWTATLGFVVDANIPDILNEGGPENPTKAAAPFNIAHKTEAKMWEWYEEPGNEWRSRRFSAAMKGGIERYPGELFVNGVGCKYLKDDDVLVDVGGSVGSCVLHLYKAYPNLRYVVQDLPKQITAAAEFWMKNAPEAVPNGKVTLQGKLGIIMPVKGAAVYFLRVIIHDWPDHDAKTILRHLRDAADDSSKLVLFDTLAFHVCDNPDAESAAPKAPVPTPLLANLGVAGAGFDTGMDIQMLNLFNGKERTEAEFRELGIFTGWKLESIIRGPLATFTFSAV